MNKDCVRRGDIWMANLISGKGDVLQGAHPVIIVSNNRNNRRSGVVTVVPMTSSVKPPTRQLLMLGKCQWNCPLHLR